MRKMAVGVFVVASLSFAVGALAADRPDWAFPVTDKAPSAILPDDGKPKSAPGSDRSYTRAQIEDFYNPPDWYPGIHPAMPWANPRKLTDEDVYGLVAYVLAENKIIEKDAVMDAKSLPQVKMPNRDNFIIKFPDKI